MTPIRSKKTEYRLNLYERVLRSGIIMPDSSACSRCRAQHKVCAVASNSTRCAECIKAGGLVKCDVFGPSPAEWAKFERTEKQLADDLKEAREAQQRLMNHLFEMQAKVLRLEKQRESLRSRAADMLRRGLQSLDELDEVEREEREENERRALDSALPPPASTGAPPDPVLLDFSGVAVDPAMVLSPSFWEGLGFDGGTPPATADS